MVLRLSQLEAHGSTVEQKERGLETLAAEATKLDPASITPAQAMDFVRWWARLRQPIVWLDPLAGQVADTATKSIRAGQTRAN